ncbi:MAG: N,N-dimethylformamidase beta subunit family domain-containing protein [Actinomycetota bacterium]
MTSRVRRIRLLLAVFLLLPSGFGGTANAAVPATARNGALSRPRVTAVSPRTGSSRGGSLVTVTGSGFSNATRVTFGGIRGSRLSVRSSTRLTVAAPAHAAGAVFVRVGTLSGISRRTGLVVFTYGRPPVVSSVRTATVAVRGGSRVSIAGSGFGGAVRVTFGGVPGTRLLVHSSSRVSVLAPRHIAGVVHVRVTTGFGTSAPAPAARFRYLRPVAATPPLIPPTPAPPVIPSSPPPPPAPSPRGSPVAAENALPGTHGWSPLYTTSTGGALEGYASDVSVGPGESLQFHVSAAAPDAYQVMIYRLGYYQGLGGRLMGCLPSCTTDSMGQKQQVLAPDPVTGEAAQNWPVTDSMVVPSNWLSGYYVAKLTLRTGVNKGKSAPVPFIVRDNPNGTPSRMLVVSSSNTEQAYNSWGGKSLYAHNSTNATPAKMVSFDRPYGHQVLYFELPLVSFLESQPGLDPSYIADTDVDRAPGELLRHRLTLVNGHSEYWSKGMRDAYEAARAAGVNLVFWGGDQGDWQVRYQDNGRTMVGYKSSPDPFPDPAQWTTNFSKLTPPRPQCQLLGTSFQGGVGAISSYAVNAAALGDRFYTGTGFAAGDTFAGNGFEYDFVAPGCLPYTMTVFFSDASRPNIGPALRYTTPSGSTVVTIASEALAFMTGPADPRLQRFALNVLTDLGG